MEHKVYIPANYFLLITENQINSVVCKYSREMQEGDILTMVGVEGQKLSKEVAVNLDHILKGKEYGLQPGYCIVLFSYFA